MSESKLVSFKFFFLYCLISCCLLPFAANASPALEDYGRLPATSLMTLSPSGDRVAFRKIEEGVDFVVVVSLVDGAVLRMLDASKVDPKKLQFLTENDLVLVASEYKKVFGFEGKFDVSTAFRVKVDSGELEQLLTPGHGIYPGQSGLGRIVGVSPDRKIVYMPAYVSRDGDRMRTEVHAKIGGIDQNPNFSLMKVNINRPRKIREFEKGNSHSRDFFVSKEGKVIAQERYYNNKDLHQILVPDGKQWRVIYELKTNIPKINISAVTSDEKNLVVLKTPEDGDQTVYALISLADGSVTEADFIRQDKNVEAIIKDDNRKALGVRYSGFMPSYYFFDQELNNFVAKAQDAFPDHSVWLVSWTDNFEKIVVRVEGSSYADEYYTFDRSLRPRYLSTQRPNIKREDINPIGTITYSASDGLKIPTLVTIPRDKVDNLHELPAVVLPHGGPESYDRLGFNWLAQAIASQGYLVIQPQFRGSDGFGESHVVAGYGEWGKKMQSDLTDGVEFFASKGMIDPERVCIMGWSYGGYAALAGGALTPDVYKCVVSINGVSDLPLMLQQERSDHGRDHWVLSYWEKAMADGKASNKSLKAVSPAYHAENFKAPVLLIHGDRDNIVDIKQSRRMRSALKKANVPVELIVMKNDNHSLLDGENRVEAVRASIEFINTHLKP